MNASTITDAFKIIFIMWVAVLGIAGCSPTNKTAGGEVEAIYWHEGNRYTAVTENADMLEHHKIPPWGYAKTGTIKLYKDATPGEKSWYACKWTWSAWTGADLDTAYCEIHIHSLDELGTADWNHGKFGTGSTTRID